MRPRLTKTEIRLALVAPIAILTLVVAVLFIIAFSVKAETTPDIAIISHKTDNIRIMWVCAKTGKSFPYGVFPEQRPIMGKEKTSKEGIVFRMYIGPCRGA